GSTGYIYQLARAGRIIVLGREKHHHPPHAYGRTFLGHALAVTELYVQVIEATRTSPITLVTFEIESQAWRTLPGIGRRLLKPDAFARLATPQYTLSWFIEVDQGTESAPRISDKLITYSRYWANGIEQQTHNVFPKVLFVVLDADRKRQIKEVIAKQPKRARQLFQVELQADALQTLIGGDTL
ncbi:MAG TPA: replication-relaxation family protein, partial [Candidatus Saccharimonadia bacterium]|nr:replication-relaxation family protein [Candidatus Saccharimonadia bacterium]